MGCHHHDRQTDRGMEEVSSGQPRFVGQDCKGKEKRRMARGATGGRSRRKETACPRKRPVFRDGQGDAERAGVSTCGSILWLPLRLTLVREGGVGTGKVPPSSRFLDGGLVGFIGGRGGCGRKSRGKARMRVGLVDIISCG